MNCLQCGSEMKMARENYKYDASGLPGITLVGVEVVRCPNCGEYEVSIPSIEDLHRAIAHPLAYKRARSKPYLAFHLFDVQAVDTGLGGGDRLG